MYCCFILQKLLDEKKRKFQLQIQVSKNKIQELKEAVEHQKVSLDSSAVSQWGWFCSHTEAQQTVRLWAAVRADCNVCVLQLSAQTAVRDSERVFADLIHSIERRRSEVSQMIRDREKIAVSRAEGLIKRLEQEICQMKRTGAELEQLSQTPDHIHFLQVETPLVFSLQSANRAVQWDIYTNCDWARF